MSLGDSTLSAFQTAAGVAPDKMSLFIRTILLVAVFIWAAWCVYGEINHFRHEGTDVEIGSRRVTRILFIVAIMIMLVFISKGD